MSCVTLSAMFKDFSDATALQTSGRREDVVILLLGAARRTDCDFVLNVERLLNEEYETEEV